MKRQQNVMDPVTQAEAALTQAREAVAANRSERATLTEEAKRLWAEIGKDGDGSHAERKANRHSVCKARVDRLDQELPDLAAKVAETETGLTLARKEAAKEEQAALIAQKVVLNEQITEQAKALAELLYSAETLQTRIDDLAEEFGLDRPRGRLLLPRELINSKGAEVLRNALDQRRVFGLGLVGS